MQNMAATFLGRVSLPPVVDVTNQPSHPSANQASFGPPVMPTRWLRLPAFTDLWLCEPRASPWTLPTLLVPLPPALKAKSVSFEPEGSDPLTNRPRKSMALVPHQTAGSFVPSAKSQPAGQELPLNATTAPGGTTYWIISFHLSLVSVSPVAADNVEKAAYAAARLETVAKNVAPMMAQRFASENFDGDFHI